jgi:hypothetical protein
VIFFTHNIAPTVMSVPRVIAGDKVGPVGAGQVGGHGRGFLGSGTAGANEGSPPRLTISPHACKLIKLLLKMVKTGLRESRHAESFASVCRAEVRPLASH